MVRAAAAARDGELQRVPNHAVRPGCALRLEQETMPSTRNGDIFELDTVDRRANTLGHVDAHRAHQHLGHTSWGQQRVADGTAIRDCDTGAFREFTNNLGPRVKGAGNTAEIMCQRRRDVHDDGSLRDFANLRQATLATNPFHIRLL